MTFRRAVKHIDQAWPNWCRVPVSGWSRTRGDTIAFLKNELADSHSYRALGYEALLWIAESEERSKQWDAWIKITQ